MKELTEFQLKALMSMFPLTLDGETAVFFGEFDKSRYAVVPNSDWSPLHFIIESADNASLSLESLCFVLDVLLVSDLDIASLVRATLEKYAKSFNEPVPVRRKLSEEFKTAFADFV